MIRTLFQTGICCLCAAILALASACASEYSSRDESVLSDRQPSQSKPTFLIGPLQNPGTSSVTWANIGTGFSDALKSKLEERTDIQVRVDAAQSSEVENALNGPSGQIRSRLQSLRSRTGAWFVVLGRVTDFRHFAVASGGAAPTRSRTQAIAAISIDVVDLNVGRVLFSDQFEATTWASDAPIDQTYRGIQFGTQRFWDTPLGLASRDVVAQAASRISMAAPVRTAQTINIIDRISDRRVRLASHAGSRCSPGDVLYVCQYDSTGTQLRSIPDRSTGAPLKARIESYGLSPSAWLLGEPTRDVNLTKAVLSKQAPSPAKSDSP